MSEIPKDILAKAVMETYKFTIIASGVDPFDANFDDKFFEAGCDDATISVQKGAIILEFNRESKTFSHALWSAIRDVEKAGAIITHVDETETNKKTYQMPLWRI
jgi:hypothetical protein